MESVSTHRELRSQSGSPPSGEEQRTLSVRAGLWITRMLKAVFFVSVNRTKRHRNVRQSAGLGTPALPR